MANSRNSFNEAPAKGGGEYNYRSRYDLKTVASMRPPQKAGGNVETVNIPLPFGGGFNEAPAKRRGGIRTAKIG